MCGTQAGGDGVVVAGVVAGGFLVGVVRWWTSSSPLKQEETIRTVLGLYGTNQCRMLNTPLKN